MLLSGKTQESGLSFLTALTSPHHTWRVWHSHSSWRLTTAMSWGTLCLSPTSASIKPPQVSRIKPKFLAPHGPPWLGLKLLFRLCLKLLASTHKAFLSFQLLIYPSHTQEYPPLSPPIKPFLIYSLRPYSNKNCAVKFELLYFFSITY